MSDNKPFHKRKFPACYTVTDQKELVKIANEKKLDSARFNYHESDESLLHQMLIFMTETVNERIHKHNDKDEIIQIESGKIRINIYDSSLEIINVVELDPSNNKSFLIPKGTIHSVNITSKDALFLEFAQGPFRPKNTDWFTNK